MGGTGSAGGTCPRSLKSIREPGPRMPGKEGWQVQKPGGRSTAGLAKDGRGGWSGWNRAEGEIKGQEVREVTRQVLFIA